MTPVPSVRHSDSADPAPPSSWRGVRQHPVPARRHSGGHAPPHAVRRGVAHGPVPSAGWLRHRRWLNTMIRVRPCRAVPGAPGWSCICQSPSVGTYWREVGGGNGLAGWPHPRPPLHHVERGCMVGPPVVPPLRQGDGKSRVRGNDGTRPRSLPSGYCGGGVCVDSPTHDCAILRAGVYANAHRGAVFARLPGSCRSRQTGPGRYRPRR